MFSTEGIKKPNTGVLYFEDTICYQVAIVDTDR